MSVLPAADDTHRQFVQGVKDEVGKILGVLPNADQDITLAVAQAISNGDKLDKLLNK